MTPRRGRRSRAAPRRRGRAAAALVLSLLAGGALAAPYTVRQGPPPPPPPAGAVAELRALLFGDFGARTPQQRSVAAAMARAARQRPFDVAFSLGDNLYECGPDPRLPGADECRFSPDDNTVAPGYTPPDDPRFRELFEAPLEELGSLPVHVALGNHDVHAGFFCAEGDLPARELSRLRACLEVAHRSPRWAMPARRYVVDRGPARFVVLDTNLLLGDYGGFAFDAEVAFLADAARTAGDRLLFVVGHHPTATAGGHRLDHDRDYVARVRRLEEAAGGRIAAWFAGHDHDLQHLRAAAGYDVIVSGNTAKGRPAERFRTVVPTGARLLFASTEWGFATLQASGEHWSIRFENDLGTPLHCCHATRPGRCEPVTCAAPQ